MPASSARPHLVAALAASVVAAGAAQAAPYNPGQLPANQLTRVQDVCVRVMGLNSGEPESTVWGAAVAPGLTPGENHYQGCVASLSSSLRAQAQVAARVQADADCRLEGAGDDMASRAQCVLTALNDGRGDRSAQSSILFRTASVDPVAHGSFYRTGHHERLRREEAACAAIGLNPAGEAFAPCVKGLIDTFFAIDNPDY